LRGEGTDAEDIKARGGGLQSVIQIPLGLVIFIVLNKLKKVLELLHMVHYMNIEQ